MFEGAEAPQAAATQPQRAWGPLKSLKNDKIHKIHTPKLQRGVFSEGAEAPQAADTAAKGLGGPEIVKNHKIHRIHTPTLQRGVFSEGAEAPQAADTDAKGWGTLEPANKYKFQKYMIFSNLKEWKVEIGTGTVST